MICRIVFFYLHTQGAVGAAVIHRFVQMFFSDIFHSCQIGDGSGDL